MAFFIVAALAACIAVIVGMVGPVKAGRTPTNSQLSGPEKCWLEDKQFPFGQVFFFRGELLVSGSAIFEGVIFLLFFAKKVRAHTVQQSKALQGFKKLTTSPGLKCNLRPY